MLDQNPFDLLDRFGISLNRVTGTDDFFRNDPVNVRADIFNHPVPTLLDGTVTLHGDNRVRYYPIRNRNRCWIFNKKVPGSHIGNARRNPAGSAEDESLGLQGE